jgi:hypothetical protein
MSGVRAATQIGLAVAFLSLGCRDRASSSTLDFERRTVSDWVVLPGSSIAASRGTAWRGSTLSETWELSVPLTWAVYRRRLRDAMSAGYHEISSDGAHQAFSRASTGDAFSVSLDLVSPGPPLRVRVTFTAAPD